LRTDSFDQLDLTWEISELRVWHSPSASLPVATVPTMSLTAENSDSPHEAATSDAADAAAGAK
jgi:hypothetical protein